MKSMFKSTTLNLLLMTLIVVLLPTMVQATDLQYWQGQFHTDTTFHQGNYSFNFTVYDNRSGGNVCFENTTTLNTTAIGYWHTEQYGVLESCPNTTLDYYLNIEINNTNQEPRFFLSHLKNAIAPSNFTPSTNSTTWLGDINRWFNSIYATTLYESGTALSNIYCRLNGCNMTQSLYVTVKDSEYIRPGLSITSTNPNQSAVWITGNETGHGSLKISHTYPYLDDSNAAGLSIDIKGSGTAAQGIYVTSDGNTTGDLIHLVNRKENMFQVTDTGDIELEGNITFSNDPLSWIMELRGIKTLSSSSFLFDTVGTASWFFRDSSLGTILNIRQDGLVLNEMLNITSDILMFATTLSGSHELNSTRTNATIFTENGVKLEDKYRQITDDRNLTTTDIANLGYITSDSNASTECNSDEVLLGNTTCLGITNISGSGGSSDISTFSLTDSAEYTDTSGVWDAIITDTFGESGTELISIFATADMKDTGDTANLRIRVNDSTNGYMLLGTGWVASAGAGAKPTLFIPETVASSNTFDETGASYVTKYTSSPALMTLDSEGTVTVDFKRGSSGTAYVKNINVTIKYQ